MNRRELLLGLSSISLPISTIKEKIDAPIFVYSDKESLLKAFPLEEIQKIICERLEEEHVIKWDKEATKTGLKWATSKIIELPVTNLDIYRTILDITMQWNKCLNNIIGPNSYYVDFKKHTTFNINIFIDDLLPSNIIGFYGWMSLGTNLPF